MSIDEIGGAAGVQPSRMRRLVRGLAGLGLVGVDDDDRVSVTELGALLGSNARGSMRDVALYFGGEGFPAWGELHHALTTGELAFEAARGETFFDYLQRHPQASAAFNGTMTQMSHGVVAQAVAAYDFSSATAVLDVAGGHGHFVAAVLEANAELSGAVFDLPHVTEAAAQHLASRGMTDRCAVAGGSFFEALPAGYDVHILNPSGTRRQPELRGRVHQRGVEDVGMDLGIGGCERRQRAAARPIPNPNVLSGARRS